MLWVLGASLPGGREQVHELEVLPLLGEMHWVWDQVLQMRGVARKGLSCLDQVNGLNHLDEVQVPASKVPVSAELVPKKRQVVG